MSRGRCLVMVGGIRENGMSREIVYIYTRTIGIRQSEYANRNMQW